MARRISRMHPVLQLLTLAGACVTIANAAAFNVEVNVRRVAAPTISPTSINFGIVHVGDVLAPRALSVANGIGAGDSLLASITAMPAGFTGAGTLGALGLAPGATSTALTMSLNTAAAGVFAGNGTVSFASHRAGQLDIFVSPQVVALSGQVNNFAHPILAQRGGNGALSGGGNAFLFDFGTVTQGSATLTGLLKLSNLVAGPADLLAADFSGAAGPFALTGFGNFTGLAAGAAHNMAVSFNPLTAGLVERLFSINLFSDNASGFHGNLGRFDLRLRVNVAPLVVQTVAPSAVPLPGAAWMLGGALLGMLGMGRRVTKG